MKILRTISKTLLWIVYLMLSGKERQIYQHAKFRNRECLDVENDICGSTYTMGKHLYGKEPERNFLTWKEFREIHKF